RGRAAGGSEVRQHRRIGIQRALWFRGKEVQLEYRRRCRRLGYPLLQHRNMRQRKIPAEKRSQDSELSPRLYRIDQNLQDRAGIYFENARSIYPRERSGVAEGSV